MEQEKKRVRPTWAMVKSLEGEVAELKEKLRSQIEGTSMLVGDCDAWRDKYHELMNSAGATENDLRLLKERNNELTHKCNMQERELDEYKDMHRAALKEIEMLRSRSLWQRIMNK